MKFTKVALIALVVLTTLLMLSYEAEARVTKPTKKTSFFHKVKSYGHKLYHKGKEHAKKAAHSVLDEGADHLKKALKSKVLDRLGDKLKEVTGNHDVVNQLVDHYSDKLEKVIESHVDKQKEKLHNKLDNLKPEEGEDDPPAELDNPSSNDTTSDLDDAEQNSNNGENNDIES